VRVALLLRLPLLLSAPVRKKGAVLQPLLQRHLLELPVLALCSLSRQQGVSRARALRQRAPIVVAVVVG
jgi:hypothetical protein